MQVGTTKDQGLYNKPSAAVHPGALAAETLPHYILKNGAKILDGNNRTRLGQTYPSDNLLTKNIT